MVKPLGVNLMGGGGFQDIARPDLSGQIRRDYAGNLADIQQDVNTGIGSSEDYYTSIGLGRSGMRGMGFGNVVRGGDIARAQARQTEQGRLTDEQLQAYNDALRRRGMDINARLQGANVLTGQQSVFNPYADASLAGSSLSGATGGRSAAGAGFYNASQIPGTLSKVLSAIGGVAGAAMPMFGAGGMFGQGGRYGPGFSAAKPFAAQPIG